MLTYVSRDTLRGFRIHRSSSYNPHTKPSVSRTFVDEFVGIKGKRKEAYV